MWEAEAATLIIYDTQIYPQTLYEADNLCPSWVQDVGEGHVNNNHGISACQSMWRQLPFLGLGYPSAHMGSSADERSGTHSMLSDAVSASKTNHLSV
jgi:hypothetical protein